MKPDYTDILIAVTLASEKHPLWWDANGAPRYLPFLPLRRATAYSQATALIEVKCGGCERKFQVEVSHSRTSIEHVSRWIRAVQEAKVQYGYPPQVGCCQFGHITSTIPLRTLEIWQIKDHAKAMWQRVEVSADFEENDS